MMNKLTAEARATIMDACQSISRSADALKDCHTVDGDWGDDLAAKAFYDAELTLLERLTALLAHPGQPVADDAAVRGDERAAFEWPPLPVFPESFAHVAGHAYFTEHQMQGYANAYGEAVRAAAAQAVATERIRAMFMANPPDELGPTDEPESQYRFGYNTALEDVLEALASLPTKKAGAGQPERRSHRWDDEGERCVVCGDKDWMGDPVCHGRISEPRVAIQGKDHDE